jgi:uncharacterized membrane-anchored protein YjiN (DUF445 family)
MELSQEAIEEGIICKVADEMIHSADMRKRIQHAVDERIDKLFQTVANAQITRAVEEAIKQSFEREFCRVDSFGQQVGKTTTIRKELEILIGDYWNTKVDKQGKPCTSYSSSITRAEYIMTKLVAADFEGEMKQHVINIGSSLKDKLRSELHETVDKLLSEVFHVRSKGDNTTNQMDKSLIHPNQKGDV